MKNNQRGFELLTMALLTAVITGGVAVYSTFTNGVGAAGTYSVVSDRGSLIRTDTRTGVMERCSVAGTQMTCATISAQQ